MKVFILFRTHLENELDQTIEKLQSTVTKVCLKLMSAVCLLSTHICVYIFSWMKRIKLFNKLRQKLKHYKGLQSQPEHTSQGSERTLVVDLFQESHKFVSYDMQYHHCHAKNHFTNNWVCQILTSFGIGFIFIARTLLLLIFQIHIF